jgi:hypothetical protein
MRGLVETINDFVWEIDADGRDIYVNPIASGAPRAYARGTSLFTGDTRRSFIRQHSSRD